MMVTDYTITFPEGILGFPHIKRFVILEEESGSPLFRWLQALDDPEVAFVVADPAIFMPDYCEKIPVGERYPVALFDRTDGEADAPEKQPILLVIITVPQEDPMKMSANLLGPLVINPQTRMAKQIVLSDEGYSSEHPVFNLVAAAMR
ncbi:MAG: flagellar assembly protein FliW [Nitrospiria bacterium]